MTVKSVDDDLGGLMATARQPQEDRIFPTVFVAAKAPTRFLNPSSPIEEKVRR